MTLESLKAIDDAIIPFMGRFIVLLIVFVIVPAALVVVGIGQGSVTVWLISPVLWIAVFGRPFIREFRQWLRTRKEETSCW